MRILITSHYALPHRGGIEVLVDELAKRWVEQGNDIVHLTSDIAQRATSVAHAWSAGYTMRVVPASNVLERHAIPFPLFHPTRLAQTLAETLENVDIVCVQGMLYMNSVLACVSGRRRRLPVVLCEYPGLIEYGNPAVNLAERAAFETIGRLSARNCDAAVVINRRVGDFVQRYLPRQASLHLIPVGVDTRRFRPASAERRIELRDKWGMKRPVVLFAGRLVPRKGIGSLEHLTSPAYEILVCGRGEYHGRYEGMRFLGFVSDDELLELYQASDVFVLLTEGDDFPLVGIETMSCGLPLVAFDTPANREYHDDSTAVLVRPGLPAVREALADLTRDDGRRQKMSVYAVQRAAARFDLAVTAESYLALFRQLLLKPRC